MQAATSRDADERRSPVAIALVASIALLGALGLLALGRAEELSGLESPFLLRQAIWWSVALAGAYVLARIDFRRMRWWSYSVYAVCLALLVAVYFLPAINGSHRWIRLGPIGIQPAEFAKLATVLALARYLMHNDSQRRWSGLAAAFAIVLVPLVLILREPDLGTSLVFLPVLFAMLIAAGARSRHLGLAIAFGLLLTPVLWTQMSREQRSRVTALADQAGPAEKPTADGWHLRQSKQTLAHGGVWGSFLVGDERLDEAAPRLPVAHSDFIFSVIGERFGLVGLGLALTLFGVLVRQVLLVARDTREPFGRLVCVGIAALFAVEITINTAMTVGLAPVTGLSLPLVSYGGSGLIAHGLAIGLVLSVARHPGYEMGPAPFQFAERD